MFEKFFTYIIDRFLTEFFVEVVWPASVAFSDVFFDCFASIMVHPQKFVVSAFAVKFDEFVILFIRRAL